MSLQPTYPNPLSLEASELAGNLAALAEAMATRAAAVEAIIDGATRLTHADLHDRVVRAATGLAALGIRSGDVVAYQLPNWWEAAVTFLSTIRLGAIALPLPLTFREHELALVFAQAAPRAVVIPEEFRGFDHAALFARLDASCPEHVIVARGRAHSFAFDALLHEATASAPRIVPPNPSDLAMVMYTSGTTSAPKGVLHSHATLAAEVLSLARIHGLSPDDRTLMPSPVAHVSGVIHGILAPAVLGTCAVYMDRWLPEQALATIATERITYMVGAPVFLQEMIEAAHASPQRRGCGSLRLFSCGGAPVSAELIGKAREVFPNCLAKRVYGSTELPTLTTSGERDSIETRSTTEGRAIRPAEVRIVDAGGALVAAGREGEIQARGPERFLGYLDASLNDEAFTADGWFRTGDLGSLDADGNLRVTGRIKEVVIRKGEKISIRELEEAIARHPAVAEVAIIARPDAATGERACAIAQLRPGAALTLAEICAFLTSCGLPRHKLPAQLECVDALPHTESGKVARSRLR